MDTDFLRALALWTRALELLASFNRVNLYESNGEPGIRAGIGATWREVARLISAAADLVDPREAVPADPLRELFR